jgi:hypothetical protein
MSEANLVALAWAGFVLLFAVAGCMIVRAFRDRWMR